MLNLDYLATEDVYELGNIVDAVKKISDKLYHFDQAKEHAILIQDQVIREQSIEKITQSLVTAIEAYDRNPQAALRYFKQQVIATGNELDARMNVITRQQGIAEERLTIINQQSVILEERLALINSKDKLLEECNNLIQEREAVLQERLDIITTQQQELVAIKSKLLFKIGRKLKLL